MEKGLLSACGGGLPVLRGERRTNYAVGRLSAYQRPITRHCQQRPMEEILDSGGSPLFCSRRHKQQAYANRYETNWTKGWLGLARATAELGGRNNPTQLANSFFELWISRATIKVWATIFSVAMDPEEFHVVQEKPGDSQPRVAALETKGAALPLLDFCSKIRPKPRRHLTRINFGLAC